MAKRICDVTLDEFRRVLTFRALRVMQIVHGALAVSVVSFPAIVILTGSTRAPTRTPLSDANFLSAANAGAFLINSALSYFVYKLMLNKKSVTKQQANAPDAALNLIRAALILRIGLREGAAMFGLVACLIISNYTSDRTYWLNAIPAIVFLIDVIITFPTRQRVENIFLTKIHTASNTGGAAK